MASKLNPLAVCRSLVSRCRPRVLPQQPSITSAFARHFTSQPPTSNEPVNNGSSIPPIPPDMRPPGEASKDASVNVPPKTPNQPAVARPDPDSRSIRPVSLTGLKFDEPPMPMARLHEAKYHMRFRYDEGIQQITRLLMRDGKLGKAQNDVAMVLNYLRTSPPPKINPQRPLLPGAPPAEHLPLNPNLYFMLAVDSVAPLIRVRGFTGLGGGGKALEVPVPLGRRARRRVAFQWIMNVVKGKQFPGSGRKMLPHRIGAEIVAVVQGTSSVWDKRQELHKRGMTLRANMNSPNIAKFKII